MLTVAAVGATLAIAFVAGRWLPRDASNDTVVQPAAQPDGAALPSAARTAAALAREPASGTASGVVPLEASLAISSIQVVVAANDTLERIFRRLQLSLGDLASMRASPEMRSRLDSLRPGESLRFDLRGETFMGLERKVSATETLRVQRSEQGFSSDIISNPLEIEVRSGTGVVRSSLFRAAEEAGLSDATALAIAKIFEYDIDFVLDIQPGDRFTVVHERLSQDEAYLRDGEILAVEFVNRGRTYRAVRFEHADGRVAYYTPEGRSMRKAFIRAPVEFSRISSRFNPTRRHPVLNYIRAHKGVDYAAPVGTPVRAAGEGRVRFLGRKGGYGNVIELEHMNRVTTLYGHLSRFAKGLSRGERVRQGEVIGYVGMTGLASGPHLHYEYRLNGVHKDPQKVVLPKADPIPEQALKTFQASTAPLLRRLDAASAQGALLADGLAANPAPAAAVAAR